MVFTSSTSALGNRGQANYSTAKAGLQGLTRTLAIELGQFGVNVNAIAPGFIETAHDQATAERIGTTIEAMTLIIEPRPHVVQPDGTVHTRNRILRRVDMTALRATLVLAILSATALLVAAGPVRVPVLSQIALPHNYYYRELYLPQLTSGPSAVAWSSDGTAVMLLDAGQPVACSAPTARSPSS